MICTLTGIGTPTDLGRLAEAQSRHPFAEWGVLFDGAGTDDGSRYPGRAFVEALPSRMPSGSLLAVHFCREAVTALVDRDPRALAIARSYGRVQINFVATRPGPSFHDLMDAEPDVTFITQHNERNSCLWKSGRPNHQVLFDGSLGRGLTPGSWPAPLPGIKCGYAGGLGPKNMANQLDLIASATGGPVEWIDHENALFEAGRFSVERAMASLAACASWMAKRDTASAVK